MVPYGYSVELFDNDGMYGSSYIVDGQQWKDEDQQMTCVNLPSEWRNKTSSLAVYRTSQGYKAAGDWVNILTLTETVGFKYHEGFETTHSSQQAIDEKYSLGMEMQEGMNFGFVKSSIDIKEGYAMEISSDTQSSINHDIDLEIDSQCTGTGGVGIW